MGFGLISGLQLGDIFCRWVGRLGMGDLVMTRGISAARPDLHGTLRCSCLRVAPRVYIYILCFGGNHHTLHTLLPVMDYFVLWIVLAILIVYIQFELIWLFGLGLFIY